MPLDLPTPGADAGTWGTKLNNVLNGTGPGTLDERDKATYGRRHQAVSRLVPPPDLGLNRSVMSGPPTITYANTAPAGTVLPFDDARLTYRGLVSGNRTISSNATRINLANGWTGAASNPTTAAVYSPFELEVDHYGTTFSFAIMALQASYSFQVYVDGHPIAAAPTAMGSVAVGGGTWSTLNFGSPALRRIRVVLPSYLGFKEVVIGATDAVAPVTKTAPSVAILGDSWVEAVGATNDLTGWVRQFAELTGFEVYRAGQGGTGYTNAGPAGQGKAVYGDASRMSGLTGANPDYVLVWGSSNDDGSGSIQSAASSLYSSLASNLPSAKVVVVGPQATNTPVPAARTTNSSAVSAAAAAASNVLGFINPLVDASGNPWFIGTGTSTAPSGSGNADVFSNGNNAGHPTQAGHDYVARRVAAEFLSIVKAA